MKQAKKDDVRHKKQGPLSEKWKLKERLKNSKSELSELEKKYKRLENVYKSIPTPIALIQDGKIIDANDAVNDMLGYAPDALIGKGFLYIIYPDSRAMVREVHNKRLARKAVPEQYEVDLKKRSGDPLPCEVRVGKTLVGSKRTFVVCLMPMDKRLEREKNRLQGRKMEALSTMASALAGRFEKTCISIRNRVERLKSANDESVKARSEELRALNAIINEAVHTTTQLKVIARTEEEFAPGATFDLGDVVKEAIKCAHPEKSDSNNMGISEVRVKTYVRAGSQIQGRPEELQAVISHLIRNAMESMPTGGDLYITSEESQGYAHLYIMDNGIGVSEQVRDRIFDPFFTTRGNGAEGLGLSVAYAVIKRHGGSIAVTSEKGQGTEIHIQLPVAGKNPDVNRKRERASQKPSKVLIIVKNRALENLLHRVLSFRGWNVVSVDSAGEGLHKLRRESYGLTILESSPWGGRQRIWLCRKIKELGKGVPIALITEDGWDDRDAFSSGFDLVLKKPLLMDTLNEKLTELF
jgi:PAS domain S-box-containing protein